MFKSARVWVIVVAAAACTATLSYAATAQEEPATAPSQPAPVTIDRPKAATAAPELRAAFAVLERSRREGDTLPGAASRTLAGGSAFSDDARLPKELSSQTTAFGTNDLLARRAADTPEGALFVIPGQGNLCVVTTRGPGFGLSCSEASRAVSAGLVQTEVSADGAGRRIQGVVPNGVVAVRVERKGDAPVGTKVATNAFVVDVAGAPTELVMLAEGGREVNRQAVAGS